MPLTLAFRKCARNDTYRNRLGSNVAGMQQ
jgi:hypothetical protein